MAVVQPPTFVAVDVSYILCFSTDMRADALFQPLLTRLFMVAMPRPRGLSRRALCCSWACMPTRYVCRVKMGGMGAGKVDGQS